MKLYKLSLILVTLISFNALAYSEPSLEIIACEISRRLLETNDISLLNKITDDSALQPELQEIIRNELKKIFLKSYPVHPELYLDLNILEGSVKSAAFSTDGKYIFIGSTNGIIRFNITKKSHADGKLPEHNSRISSVVFSPNGKYMLTDHNDGQAILSSIKDEFIQSCQLSIHGNITSRIAFSHDSRYALIGSRNRTGLLWDISKNPNECKKLIGHQHKILSVAFSPDDKFALTATARTIRLWNITQEPIQSYEVARHGSGILAVAFSPDGKYLLVGLRDGRLMLWNLAKEPIRSRKIGGNEGHIDSVAFSPDGKYILTGSTYGIVQLYHTSKKYIKAYKLVFENISLAIFSPDSRYILTVSPQAYIRIWLLNPLLKIIDQLNISELILINKLAESIAAGLSHNLFDNNPEYMQILESSNYKQEIESYYEAVQSGKWELKYTITLLNDIL